MSGLLLSEEERNRFAAWCELEASSNEEMMKQMQALTDLEGVIKKYRAEAAACRIVAFLLRSIESQDAGS